MHYEWKDIRLYWKEYGDLKGWVLLMSSVAPGVDWSGLKGVDSVFICGDFLEFRSVIRDGFQKKSFRFEITKLKGRSYDEWFDALTKTFPNHRLMMIIWKRSKMIGFEESGLKDYYGFTKGSMDTIWSRSLITKERLESSFLEQVSHNDDKEAGMVNLCFSGTHNRRKVFYCSQLSCRQGARKKLFGWFWRRLNDEACSSSKNSTGKTGYAKWAKDGGSSERVQEKKQFKNESP